jgi:hypothetical protein
MEMGRSAQESELSQDYYAECDDLKRKIIPDFDS